MNTSERYHQFLSSLIDQGRVCLFVFVIKRDCYVTKQLNTREIKISPFIESLLFFNFANLSDNPAKFKSLIVEGSVVKNSDS